MAQTSTVQKIGRNDPCPCGSGKKYKACCSKIEEKFRARSAPDLPAILARANQEGSRGNFEGAESGFREVLALNPNHAEALAGLGQSLCWRQRRQEGLEALRKSARQLEREAEKKREIGLLMQLAGQLQHWGDFTAALQLARLAVRIAPESAAALNLLSLCLGRINRTDEALIPARKACELLPRDAGCQINLALLEARKGMLENAKERLGKVLEFSLDPAQTSRANLELGVIRDRMGEHEGAFDSLSRAAEIARTLPEIRAVDHEQIFRTLAINRSGFDQALLSRWKPGDFADSCPQPAFLFGFLRSGTTLTERVLDAHPEILASDEEQFVHEVSLELANMTGIRDDVPSALRAIDLDQARRLRRFYWRRVEEEHGNHALKKRFVDKVALNTIEAGLIATLFPESKILFALRDPRDVVLSCYMQPFVATIATVNLLSWQGIARQYSKVMDFWLHLRPMIQPAYYEVRYEDTVADFENTFRRIFDLLEVEWRAEVSGFHEKAKGRFISTPSFAAVSQPLYRSAVARWRGYASYFDGVLPELQAYIDAFGYGDAANSGPSAA